MAVTALAGCDGGEHPEVSRAKAEVAGAMLDPASAEFRNIERADYGLSGVVCGEVNGNNAFGAKGGFRQFMYVDPLMRIADSSESGLAIYQCCKALSASGEVAGVETTADVAECAGVSPVMIL